MGKKLVCVLAVHNEENYLPYSLAAINELDNQIVVVLDRCTDSSEKLIRRHVKNANVVLKERGSWKNPCAEAKSLGCDLAKELGADMILVTDADVLLDINAVQKTKSLLASSNHQIVALPYRQYSLYGSPISRILNEIQNLFGFVNRKLKIHPVRFGIYVGRANVIHLADAPSEYDVLQQKAKTVWIPTKSLHLRPRMGIESQIDHGLARAKLPQYSWLKVMLFSVFTFQPFTVVGYLKGKMKR